MTRTIVARRAIIGAGALIGALALSPPLKRDRDERWRRNAAERAARQGEIARWVERAQRAPWQAGDAQAMTAARQIRRDLDTRTDLDGSHRMRGAAEQVRTHLDYIEAQASDRDPHTQASHRDIGALREALETVRTSAGAELDIGAEPPSGLRRYAEAALLGGIAGASTAIIGLSAATAIGAWTARRREHRAKARPETQRK